MRKGQGPAGVVRVDQASSASAFRELDDAFLQKQTKIWLGEVLHLRFDEDTSVADLLADGEILFQVSKVLWKRLLKKNREQLKQSKVYIFERLSFGKSSGKYMPYSKVDSFLKICQILGLAGIDLFTPSDVVEKRNVRKVCICIRSVSKRSHMMHLNVPDFDIVTYTVSMPNYIVGGIRRTLEQPQYSSSSSSGYSPRDNYKALQQQIIFDGQYDHNGDTNYDSDEAESRLSVLQPENSVEEDNFADILSQLNDATKEEGKQGCRESGPDTHEEKSLAESVGSLNLGCTDSVDSSPLLQSKESCCLAQSATDQCSRTRTAKCSLSSEESDSISSHSAFDSGKNDLELEAPVAVSEMIHSGHVKPVDHSVARNVEILGDNPNNRIADPQKDIDILDPQGDARTCDMESVFDPHCHALTCDRESVCSSCEEPRYGLNDDLSDWRSGLTPRHDTDCTLPMVSEDLSNNTEPETKNTIPVTWTATDGTSGELTPEFSTEDHAGDKSLHNPEDITKSSISPHKDKDAAPKSGKGVLKSVAGGITLFGAVFFIVHLRSEPDFEVKFVDRRLTQQITPHFCRRSKERSSTSFITSHSGKSVPSEDSSAKNMDKGKPGAVYPGERLKV